MQNDHIKQAQYKLECTAWSVPMNTGSILKPLLYLYLAVLVPLVFHLAPVLLHCHPYYLLLSNYVVTFSNTTVAWRFTCKYVLNSIGVRSFDTD